MPEIMVIAHDSAPDYLATTGGADLRPLLVIHPRRKSIELVEEDVPGRRG